MRLVTANIGRKQNAQQTRADLVAIKKLGGIVGFQEIDEADPAPETDLLKLVFAKYTIANVGSLVPIAVPKRFKVVAVHKVFGTSGVKRYSPARFFTVVVLKPKSLLNRVLGRPEKTFVVINTHYPAGAYHGTRPPAARAQLRNNWDEQFEAHKELVKKYVDKGYTVFWTGDTNRVDMPKVHSKEVRVVTVGIDSISYVPGGVKVKVIRKGVRRLFSDHNAQYADFKIK